MCLACCMHCSMMSDVTQDGPLVLLAPGGTTPDVHLSMHAGTDMTTTPNPLMTPFDRKKANAIGLRKWVRFASDGETTIMQV